MIWSSVLTVNNIFLHRDGHVLFTYGFGNRCLFAKKKLTYIVKLNNVIQDSLYIQAVLF